MYHVIGSSITCMLLGLILVTSGCAIHYFDVESGTEHVWGIGHMALRPVASEEGLKAVARRSDVVGISLGKLQDDVHLGIGWVGLQRIDIVDANTQLCLSWPRGSFYNARIGTAWPPLLEHCLEVPKETLP